MRSRRVSRRCRVTVAVAVAVDAGVVAFMVGSVEVGRASGLAWSAL
jgi:hypothetical protein